MAPDGLLGVLFIGYGNELRGDDAAGPLAARSLAARGRDAIAVHQLTPEMAERIAAARAVIFVDADASLAPGEIAIEPIAPDAVDHSFEHVFGPAGLLRLARLAYGAAPAAWLIRIGAQSFEFGDPPSRPVELAVKRLVESPSPVAESLHVNRS